VCEGERERERESLPAKGTDLMIESKHGQVFMIVALHVHLKTGLLEMACDPGIGSEQLIASCVTSLMRAKNQEVRTCRSFFTVPELSLACAWCKCS